MRGQRASKRQRCGGGTNPPARTPHAGGWTGRSRSPVDEQPRTPASLRPRTAHDDVHLLRDGDRVVPGALVVAGDQAELDCRATVASSPAGELAQLSVRRKRLCTRSSMASSMSASADAHERSRSANVFTATRSWTEACRAMRSMIAEVGPSSRPPPSLAVVLATLTIRSALRSSSWATRSVAATYRTSEASEQPAARSAKHSSSIECRKCRPRRRRRSHAARAGQVARRRSASVAATTALVRERREPDDVERQIAEPLLEWRRHHSIIGAATRGAVAPSQSLPGVHLDATARSRPG